MTSLRPCRRRRHHPGLEGHLGRGGTGDLPEGAGVTEQADGRCDTHAGCFRGLEQRSLTRRRQRGLGDQEARGAQPGGGGHVSPGAAGGL